MGRESIFFINLFFALLFVFTSCELKKKYYYYKEDGKQEKLIEAFSDSAAYVEAFENFLISKRVYNDMKKLLGNSHLNKPIRFELLNDKHEDITYKVVFYDRDSLEKVLTKDIDELPSSNEALLAEVKEGENGISAIYDTAGLYLAPVKILSARFVKEEYTGYKKISLSYKNVSNKKIAAIKFRWYGVNAFNEPADMGGLNEGWGSGFSDDVLRAGGTDDGIWNILSKDGKKVLLAYPYEVAFGDGTKWELDQ